MAAVLVGQFHARDAEGRVYSVHEFQESNPVQGDQAGSAPTTTYKLAIGDRVEKMEGDEFRLIQSDKIITRESPTFQA
ncbi:hypothetical protein ACI77J_29515 [Pseudomonas sp. O64]|uniref:hypothetical protein n=1 Tax=Pseudomonas TaxID=286 RepID=UPI000BA01CEF|nr:MULTISPECIES: hypothetical protein [unclassified Pseudomonas]MCV2229888.1 hypothetical protein [Pseudomonas sp. AU10]OZO01031.1 hypothetical protein B7453_29025 [Pseudomonas sp. IB20]UNM22416.1 hypothetical protein K0P33_13615 [Pseudomonas sp. ArH3a]UXZ25051.1 hypothetical protein KZH41_12985 [Pseudomonas sp. YeP6b]